MKKIFILFLLISSFLVGCERNNIFPMNNNPEIVVKKWTGLVVKWISDADITDKKYKRKREVDPYGVEYESATVTGYLYEYLYKDLGIKITTPANYEPYFSTLTQEPLFKRYYNIIYNAKDPDIDADFIAVYVKDPKVSLQEEVMKKHLPEWCDSVASMILWKLEANRPSMVWFQAVFTENSDHNNDTCKMDKQFPNRRMPVEFVMDPKHPEKYYKIGMSDWCAPGPCSIFGNIEFF